MDLFVCLFFPSLSLGLFQNKALIVICIYKRSRLEDDTKIFKRGKPFSFFSAMKGEGNNYLFF